MSDIIYHLQIPGARLESVERSEDAVTLRFSRVELIQVMENAFDDSLWYQAVNLTISNCEVEGDLPETACDIESGEMTDNIYTYRDSAPLPVNWRGDVSCSFTAAGKNQAFSISGDSMSLEQVGHPRYLKHVKKDKGVPDALK
jgi:hypothetical protein